jgi:hypothetical protein
MLAPSSPNSPRPARLSQPIILLMFLSLMVPVVICDWRQGRRMLALIECVAYMGCFVGAAIWGVRDRKRGINRLS